MKINVNQSSNIFFPFLHSNGPLCSPHKITPIFQDCPNPGAGGRQVRCCKWLHHLLVLGHGCSSGTPGGCLLKTVSWAFILSLNEGQQYCTLCWLLGILRGEKDWPATCPRGAHSLEGRGTDSHHHHLGLWEGWGDKPKMTWQREERIGGGKRLIQEAAQMS